jgi:hypothetical protein
MSRQYSLGDVEVPERRYDSASDRLFLVYYPITPGYNRNKWGVSEQSLHTNIHTAINKPVVVYRKNPNNPIHTKQAGSFIHPTPEEAATELGHPPNAEEYYNWQEKFAVGRVRSVDKRDKGYAFTLEITDNEAKNILKSDIYRTGVPGWTSPQIISNGHLYPNEETSGVFDHWTISHIALLDVPAYGYDQAGVRAKCFGAEKDCMIQTRSASQENLGFCVKQATIDLVQSRTKKETADTLRTLSANLNSSQSSPESQLSHTIMSQSENTAPKSSETVTYTAPNDTTTPQPVNTNNNKEPSKEEAQTQQTLPVTPTEEPKAPTIEGAKNLEEANIQIRQMSELLTETNKQLKAQQKELDRIALSERRARLAFIIPRDLFRSDESHMKEVDKTMNEKVSESWLIDYWKTKRELAMTQSTARKMVHEEEPPTISAKSASVSQHEVPDFSSSQNANVRSNIQKQLELQKMILEGGGSS